MVGFTFLKMLVPTAGPVAARENAEYILHMAKRLNSEVVVIHIRDKAESSDGQIALQIFAELAAKLDVKCATRMILGDIVPAIIEEAERENIDLIVMGASRGSIVAEWIVSEVLKETRIPIVIIPFSLANAL